MKNVQHTKHLEKRNSNWFNTGLFAFSLLALCILICSFRFPSTSESGGFRLTRNLNIPRSHSEGEIELRILERGARGDYPAAERTGSRGGEVDLGKLAYAVAVAESSNCTRGGGVSKNNCHGIMTWQNGVRELKSFETKEKSYEEFKFIWKKSYGGFPDSRLAWKWVCGSKAKECPESEDWLKNVKINY